MNVLAVGDGAGFGIYVVEDVLEDGLLVAEELAGLPIQLPEDAVLAGAEDHLAVLEVDQHPLEDLVEVEALAGDVLEVPLQQAVVRPQGDRRAGVERRVVHGHAPAYRDPRLRLRHPEVDQVEHGIVAAGDPGLAAPAQEVGQVGPGVAPGLVRAGHGVEAPELLAAGRVVGADEAAFAGELAAAAESPARSCRRR